MNSTRELLVETRTAKCLGHLQQHNLTLPQTGFQLQAYNVVMVLLTDQITRARPPTEIRYMNQWASPIAWKKMKYISSD